jgi:hypothetical protein
MAKKWKMPAWMEPFRDEFANTGGNPIEELMNDKDTHYGNNAVRAALIVAVDSQVHLLNSLHARGALCVTSEGTQT